jgi:hypothetical protein
MIPAKFAGISDESLFAMKHALAKILCFTLVLSGIFIFPAYRAGARTELGDVPLYPQGKVLCDQHVSGNTMHILWRSYGSQAAVPTVVAFFEKKLGVTATPAENQSFSMAHPRNADLKIVVFPKTQAQSFPQCGVAPEASANTIILISDAIH